jgi:hypothetical protein
MFRALLAVVVVGMLVSVVVAGLVAGTLQTVAGGAAGGVAPDDAARLADAVPGPETTGPLLESVSTFLSGVVLGIVAGIAVAHDRYQRSM